MVAAGCARGQLKGGPVSRPALPCPSLCAAAGGVDWAALDMDALLERVLLQVGPPMGCRVLRPVPR